MGNLENLTKFITPAVLGLTVAGFTAFRGQKALKKEGNKSDGIANPVITWLRGAAVSALFGCLAGFGFAAVATVAREALTSSPATLQNEGIKSALILGAATALQFTKPSYTTGLKILAEAATVAVLAEVNILNR